MSACGCRCASLRAALRGCLAGRTKSMLVLTEVRCVGALALGLRGLGRDGPFGAVGNHAATWGM